MAVDWSKKEVALIIQDYFKMLQQELNQQKYNKASYRKSLVTELDERSHGSVEFKHQNISAVLAEVGAPFIKGYKPRYNYQQLLADQVLNYISENRILLEKEFENFAAQPATQKQWSQVDFNNLLDDEPALSVVKENEPTFKPIKINYLEKEQNNRNLGEAGEALIIQYEKWRLVQAGKDNLADKVEWISKDLGDGTGFDILSKNNNGTDRYIEVKTTKLSKEAPIFLTSNELSFAQLKSNNFFLYRLFNFNSAPQFFIKSGNYAGFCKLIPASYKGFF